MAKSITVQFEDGSSHVYDDVPDNVSTEDVNSRAMEEFNKPILTSASPNQGPEIAGNKPPEAGAEPQMGDYMMLNKDVGQLAAGAAVPLQMAAQHPYEAATAAGLYKFGQGVNAYKLGKETEAAAQQAVAAQRAQSQAGHQAIQQQKINLKAGAPVAGPVNPTSIVGANGLPMQPPPATTGAVAATQTAPAAEQSLASKVREVAASKIAGLSKASPMLASAGRVAGKALPLAGTALGAVDTYNRANEGDYLGAGISGLGTLASVVPVVGTGINLAATGINAGRDYSKYLEAKKKYEAEQKKKIK